MHLLVIGRLPAVIKKYVEVVVAYFDFEYCDIWLNFIRKTVNKDGCYNGILGRDTYPGPSEYEARILTCF
jgi:hypothetical protein